MVLGADAVVSGERARRAQHRARTISPPASVHWKLRGGEMWLDQSEAEHGPRTWASGNESAVRVPPWPGTGSPPSELGGAASRSKRGSSSSTSELSLPPCPRKNRGSVAPNPVNRSSARGFISTVAPARLPVSPPRHASCLSPTPASAHQTPYEQITICGLIGSRASKVSDRDPLPAPSPATGRTPPLPHALGWTPHVSRLANPVFASATTGRACLRLPNASRWARVSPPSAARSNTDAFI